MACVRLPWMTIPAARISAAKLRRGVPSDSCFLCFLGGVRLRSINFRGGGLKVRSIGCCPRRRHTTIIVGQNPEPAAAFPRPFDGDELHLLSGISDLSFAESALCASLYNQGCRRRPVRQNVLQKDFWVFPPAWGLFDRHFSWRRSPCIATKPHCSVVVPTR